MARFLLCYIAAPYDGAKSVALRSGRNEDYMVMKPSNTSYSRQQVVERRHRVGEDYRSRREHDIGQEQLKASKSTFFQKIKDIFSGSKVGDAHKFAPRAEYIRGTSPFDAYNKTQMGIKDYTSTDKDLIATLDQICKK